MAHGNYPETVAVPRPSMEASESDVTTVSTTLQITVPFNALCVWVAIPGGRVVQLADSEPLTRDHLSQRERVIIRALLSVALDEVAD